MDFQYILGGTGFLIGACFFVLCYVRHDKADFYGHAARRMAERILFFPSYIWILYYALICFVLSILCFIKGFRLVSWL